MASPLVATKLYLPRLRRGQVARPRLTERLRRGSEARLTLISAPPGFGKTTLLAEWLGERVAASASGPRSVAWLSLDEGDGRAASFWTYVIAALQTVVPGIGSDALAGLQSAQAPVETVLATVLNDLSAAPGDVHLVLDDYHLADGDAGVRAGMSFLLEHLPPHVHLVISTRADPLLPLARLRARGELVEIRAAELRFTPEEAAAYLNDVAGLDLTADDVATLEARTEGWIAALQLAALSMQGRDDVGGFIAGFAGDDRYIVDYLVAEVLQRQPEQVRTFLLRTCLLDRLSGPLCDAVTEEHDGRAVLESLDRANLFVVSLDDNRHWYRYHRLFADVLQGHLRDERADEVADLHLRASQWYDRNGEPSPAVRHALAAGDVERAASLVERAIPDLLRNRQEAVIRGWLDAIPDDVVRLRPVLAVGLVGALMAGGEFESVEGRLRDAERWLHPATGDQGGRVAPSADMVVVDESEFARLPGAIEMYRAALALIRGDRPATIRHAERAIGRVSEDDLLVLAAASALLGLASWGRGDLEGAHRAYCASVERLERAGHIADVLGCSIAMADIRSTQGRLSDALSALEHALRLASWQPGPALRGTADMYVGMSRIALERADLPTAVEYLQRSQDLGERAGLPQNPYRWRVAMARVRESQGDLGGALTLLDEAQRVYTGDFSPDVRPVAASRARVLAALGQVDAALGWAGERGLSADDDPSYEREFEHVTLVRLLLARHARERDANSLREAARLLERLLPAAEAGGRTGSVIEILVLQALTRHADGDTAGAFAPLGRALALAEPEGYVRVFVDEGPPMASLLTAFVKRHGARDHVGRLLDAVRDKGGSRPAGAATASRLRQGVGLVDPLSERELDVLRLLATDLDGPDIARRLMVSLNTMRTHTKNIYTKLGVNSRRAAVRRAEALDLLSQARDR